MKAALSTSLSLSILAARALFSPFSPAAGADHCDSKHAISKGYSIGSGPTNLSQMSFSGMGSTGAGASIPQVKCSDGQASDNLLLGTGCLRSFSGSLSASDGKQTP
jgi:hypothetical protein